MSAIDGKPVSALVKAITETRVLRLSQDVFWNRLMAVPGVARNLLVVLTMRMRRNTEVMLEGQRRKIELEYLRQELDVARQLQIGMLPLHGMLFPERRDIEIAGMMEAADSIGGDLFVTLFCGFLDVTTGRLTYSNGGHLSPVLWRDGQASSLPLPKGTIIGVIPGSKYVQREITLNAGDFMLCFTDGVTEAQTAEGEEFTEPRLLNLVGEIVHHPLDTILNKVRGEVATFSGDHKLADDCTLLAIRRPVLGAR